ncbi:hypothetical protein ACNKHP_09640 [Shigella boydii]
MSLPWWPFVGIVPVHPESVAAVGHDAKQMLGLYAGARSPPFAQMKMALSPTSS